jgi:TatD DNase family protein
MSRYVDAHCHVDRYQDPRAVLRAGEAAGVVTIAVTELPSMFQKHEMVLRGVPGLRLALGLHPLRAGTANAMELGLFRRLIDRTDYVGEVGLDFSREGKASRVRQLQIFEAVLAHPRITEKVLSVHTRGAEAECIDRLAGAGATAILHWYSGPLGQLDRAVAAGFYFSVNPAMLSSRNGQRILDRIPRDRVLTETDGPYTRVAGRVAEPRDVPWLVEQLAARWTDPQESVQQAIFENMAAVFESTAPR